MADRTTAADLFIDKTLKCLDCGAPFMWPASEQAFFQSKQFAPPKRCVSCRSVKRQRFADLDDARDGRW